MTLNLQTPFPTFGGSTGGWLRKRLAQPVSGAEPDHLILPLQHLTLVQHGKESGRRKQVRILEINSFLNKEERSDTHK